MAQPTLDSRVRAYSRLWADREKRDEAKELAKTIVSEYHDELGGTFTGMTPEAIVSYVDRARDDGDDLAVMRAEVWLMAEHEPTRITGSREA